MKLRMDPTVDQELADVLANGTVATSAVPKRRRRRLIFLPFRPLVWAVKLVWAIVATAARTVDLVVTGTTKLIAGVLRAVRRLVGLLFAIVTWPVRVALWLLRPIVRLVLGLVRMVLGVIRGVVGLVVGTIAAVVRTVGRAVGLVVKLTFGVVLLGWRLVRRDVKPMTLVVRALRDLVLAVVAALRRGASAGADRAHDVGTGVVRTARHAADTATVTTSHLADTGRSSLQTVSGASRRFGRKVAIKATDVVDEIKHAA